MEFVASLVTLVGVAGKTSKTIYDLYTGMRDAPSDVKSLLDQLQTFQRLLVEYEAQLQDYQATAPSQDTLQDVWSKYFLPMEQDIQNLDAQVSKVRPLLETKNRRSKVILSARKLFSEKEVMKYQGRVEKHCATLSYLQSIATSRKIEQLSQTMINFGEENRTSFQTLRSDISQATTRLGDGNRSSFGNAHLQLAQVESSSEARVQTILSHMESDAQTNTLNAQKLNEITRRQNDASSLMDTGIQAISAKLDQFGGQIQKSQIAIRPVTQVSRLSPTKGKAHHHTVSETKVYCKWNHCYLPFGALIYSLEKAQQRKLANCKVSHDFIRLEISVTFVAPMWLSKHAIKFMAKMEHDLLSNEWTLGSSLNPVAINDNPSFTRAVLDSDIEGVRKSFRDRIARPTDYVLLKRKPLPWLEVIRQLFHTNPSQRIAMYEFVIVEGLPAQDRALLEMVHLWSQSESHGVINKRLITRLSAAWQTYVSNGGEVFAKENSVMSRVLFSDCREFNRYRSETSSHSNHGDLDWLPGMLFRLLDLWTIDDLPALTVCLIGSLVHVDRASHELLKRSLAALSRFSSSVDQVLQAKFGLPSIIECYRKLEAEERYSFLVLLCRKGSAKMLELFVDVGIELDDWKRYGCRLLCLAALSGNVEKTELLLENIEQFEPVPITYPGWDPTRVLLSSRWYIAKYSRSQILEILLIRGGYLPGRLHGWNSRSPHDWTHDVFTSYMFQAIGQKDASAVNLLLKHGAKAEMQIDHLFDCSSISPVRLLTWLTYSVHVGSGGCAATLLRHGADVTTMDGSGRSAIQIAKTNLEALHPRKRNDKHTMELEIQTPDYVSAEEDGEVLAAVKHAFDLKFQGSRNFDDWQDPDIETKALEESPADGGHRSWKDGVFFALLKSFLRFLGFESRHELVLKDLWWNIRHLWNTSPWESLLIRVLYVVSYALLLSMPLYELARGIGTVGRPSRSLLFAVVALILALNWTATWLGPS